MILSLKHKVVGLAIIAASLTALVISGVVSIEKSSTSAKVRLELDKLMQASISQISLDIYAALETANNLIQQQVNNNLNVARDTLNRKGQVGLSSETSSWQAVNQLTNTSISVVLPRMTVGGEWLGQIRALNATVPIVDRVKQLVGGTSTIFQRMNKQGDMLRVATNVETQDHSRAIGTYIPAVSPEGTPNPVVSTILHGETYRGRAYVVNAWYLTAYEPIKDTKGEIIGMLFVGVKQEAVESLRKEIMATKVGKTGYVYILGGKGDQKGHYILSKDGKRDGENIWNSIDANGRLFIQSIVNKALPLKQGEVAVERYPWKNAGDSEARMKIAVIAYFEPWDWVIGSGAYEDEFYEAHNQVESALNGVLQWSLIGAAVVLGLVTILAFSLGGGIVRPLEIMAHVADKLSAGNLEQSVDHRSHDETGRLADAFRKMIVASKAKEEAAKQIAQGNLTIQVPVASDVDTLGKAMVTMKNSINALAAEANMLTQAATEGRLATRGDATKFPGGYRDIIQGVNDTLDAVICPLTMAANYMDRISKGDMPPKITETYHGDYNAIKNNLNTCIDAINAMIADANMLSKTAVEGKLDARADASKHQGDFHKIIQGVNDTLDALITPLKMSADYIDSISKGIMPPKIADKYNGDFNTIKNNLNTCIDAINAMIADANMLSKAAVEGKLDARADASKHQGDFHAIIKGVNGTLDALITPLKMSADYIDSFSKGVIPPKITDRYNGDFNTIKNNLNTLIDVTRMRNEDVGMLINAAVEGKLSARAEVGKYTGENGKLISGVNKMLDALTHPLTVTAGYLDRLAKGDIPPKIAEQYQGDFNLIKNNVNTCIDSINALVTDTQMLAKAAVEGQLETRADATKHEGDYRKIVQGINDALSAIVGPINEASTSLERIADKDLTARMEGSYKGNLAKIKDALNAAVQNLDDALLQVATGAEQVASAAGQISAGSQSLSQGSSEQASSLEEVSSSLQEMASMTKQNASNAKAARGLSDAARTGADHGVDSMKRLSEAINKIKASSDATAKIVKTIDEIAFQTNLLALNAAVEAARAGDAGKGFAVVAEEVRNLAMRSAEAAKNTANLIEESVKNAESGVSINQEVLKNLADINGQVNKVSEVMAEIAAASDQQSQGVEQVNTAVEQMNQVTQQTAANAEESASAAEELSSQAAEMQSMVKSFQLTASAGAVSRQTLPLAKPRARAALPAPPQPKIAIKKPALATRKRPEVTASPRKAMLIEKPDETALTDF